MKKINFAFVAIVANLVLLSCTVNKPVEQERTITVEGSGSVSVKPDTVTLKFNIKTSDWNVTTAVERNSSITSTIIDVLSQSGITSDNLSTYDFRISQESYRQNNRDLPGQYTVNNVLIVSILNPETTGNIIDAVIKYGSNSVLLTSFDYSISDPKAALTQARALAVQSAQDAASLIAGTSGCKVGSVLEIYENSNGFSNTMIKSLNMMSMESSTPIVIGTIPVNASVTIKYSLQ